MTLKSPTNTVVYNGNRDARRMIRTLEFYDGLNVMFTVLLSTTDIITEDLEYIKCIRWEAVIMDECLNSEAPAALTFVKELASGSMILLLLDQLNENVIDYYKILSLLDHNSDFEGRQVDSDSITLLKEKLSPFIFCGPKSVPSRLVEYWVPVQMSNVQLELYCSSLLTNSAPLCSKTDPVGLLREVLISTRKCCDHPYVVEENLQARLIQGALPAGILEIGVEASGKLYFLDTILTKIKDQGKKVVILFKTFGGPGLDTIGNILDDYVCERFGKDCYERIYAGGVSSKRQASVARFNKEGRFIFLLETRSCTSGIKLSSVDAVIIYGSDWNPLNDLKALQKIKIDSKLEVKVFRLYTLCSIEEKVLLLSRKNVFLESDLNGVGFSTSHVLLTWGASFLFEKLDEFHGCPGDHRILPRCSFLKDVVQEFVSVLQTHRSDISTKFISSARHDDGGYSTDISLLGEMYSQFKDEDEHRLLWTKLLEGRQTAWIYLSLSSQRNRKRVQLYGETSDTNAHNDDTVKRQKKKDVEKEPVLACSIDSAQKISAASSPDKLCAEQNLHQMLKPDMERLFQILNLKEDVQLKAEQFLVYIIANQLVIRESDQLQAFLISVCWVAASILKKKIDHAESLSLARELLDFNCNIGDAESSFSKMQFPMRMFLAAGTEGFDIGGGGNNSICISKIKKSVAKLLNRQMIEEKKHKISWRESKAKLEKSFKMESAVIRSIHSTEAVRIDKLKMSEANHRRKLDELKSEMGIRLNSMKAKHRDEREAEEKEGIRKMNEWKSWEENAISVPTNAAEVAPAKSCSSSGHDGDISKSKSAVNDGKRELDSLGVEGAVAAEEAELSAENPTVQKVADANEESAAVRMEQHDEFLNSPSTMNPSVVLPVPQEHATETSRDILPRSDHSGGNTSDQAVYIHLPSELTIPVDIAVSHPVELTESSIPCTTPAAPIQEVLNRSLEASPRPPLHNSSYMPASSRSIPGSLPASQEFHLLHKEYERVRGESNQVTRNHDDMVLHLKSECDKEKEEFIGLIQRKYDAMVHEAEASFLQKKKELEHNQLKVVMNLKLAEAFRLKCNHKTAPQRAALGSSLTLAHPQLSVGDQNSAASSASAASPVSLPPIPEIAWDFQA